VTTVFISYRRSDEPFAVEAIEQFLIQALGADHVFRDTSDIAHGDDFRAAMDDAIGRHAVVLVVIGRGWDVSRLADPKDNVRFEIERALDLGKRVLPVLVGAAAWPNAEQLPASLASLVTKSYIAFRSGADMERDNQTILRAITAFRPVLLRGEVEGRFVIGTVVLRLDGQELCRGPMRRTLAFGPMAVGPGEHVIEAIASVTGVGRRSEYRFSVRQPGEWRLEIAYQRSSGTYSFTLHPPG
jgi:hypothetical protein